METANTTINEAISFKHRRIGRCASPPVWGCYELEVNDSDSDSMSQSQSGDEHDDDEAISVIVSSELDPVNIPLPPSPIPILIHVDADLEGANAAAVVTSLSDSLPADAGSQAQQDSDDRLQPESSQEQQQDENCTDCSKPKLDKGKGREVVSPVPQDSSPQTPTSSSDQQCTPQTPSSRLSRRAQRQQRAQHRTPKYQPILTIRSSHGWIWNQDLFVPHYMKDRYISFPPEQSEGHGVEYDCVGITLTAEDLSQVLPP
ncbi:hypothetical protein M408DRAFT_19885 [Serendipita vermifera MAFF 305830]|uniref:Uncharacterized protein n=1 Tax=Serendipita vermifera MAFF 305830 TaxID=933852 RepID=A0A0C2X6D9_SERVB|nr:hypothetical protein M408DRAFT_19885 [Serendipita vermifera MAFF 305830]